MRDRPETLTLPATEPPKRPGSRGRGDPHGLRCLRPHMIFAFAPFSPRQVGWCGAKRGHAVMTVPFSDGGGAFTAGGTSFARCGGGALHGGGGGASSASASASFSDSCPFCSSTDSGSDFRDSGLSVADFGDSGLCSAGDSGLSVGSVDFGDSGLSVSISSLGLSVCSLGGFSTFAWMLGGGALCATTAGGKSSAGFSGGPPSCRKVSPFPGFSSLSPIPGGGALCGTPIPGGGAL